MVHPRVVPLVCLARDQRKCPHLTDATHEQRNRVLGGFGIGLGPRIPDARHPLFEKVHAPADGEERDAEHLVLSLVPAGADSKDEPALAQDIDRRGLAREHCRVMKRHRAYHRAELDRLRPLRRQRKGRPAIDAIAAVVPHQGNQVLAAP